VDSSDPSREHDIRVIREERELLTKAAQDLIVILNGNDLLAHDSPERPTADKLILEISKHLGNIGGFCDSKTREAISLIQKTMGETTIEPDGWGYIVLKKYLPTFVGVQVDFNKRPFRVVGFSLEGLGAKAKAFLQK
jgi:hypothetical protein